MIECGRIGLGMVKGGFGILVITSVVLVVTTITALMIALALADDDSGDGGDNCDSAENESQGWGFSSRFVRKTQTGIGIST